VEGTGVDWADELAASVDGPQVVNDSKTPSGTVHIGSLRGPVILDVITRALRARGVETTLLYGVDDLDPMDAQALLSPDAIEREMGRPLAHVPDPAGDSATRPSANGRVPIRRRRWSAETTEMIA
jgi:lysyl-tRNA synthetase class 1